MTIDPKEVKLGSTDNPSGSSTDENPSPDDNIDWKERAQQLEDENKRLTDDNTNYKTALRTKKGGERSREVVIEKPVFKDRDGVRDDDEDEFETPEKKAVKDELDRREAKKHEDTLQSAINKFVDDHPEYSTDNDINDVRWSKLEAQIKRHAFIGDKDDIIRDIEILHRGITQPIRPATPELKTEEVEDSGIGDVPPVLKGKDKKPDALIRPLNEYEQKAADAFPGGEQAYRKRLAEKESGK